jgi:hypothetical protein
MFNFDKLPEDVRNELQKRLAKHGYKIDQYHKNNILPKNLQARLFMNVLSVSYV